MDATGNLLPRIKNQKQVLLYSIIVHDKKKKFICPISDFFSTGHDAHTIGSYLALIKNEMEKTIPKKLYQTAPIIVTDFSWALLNANCDTFNKVNMKTYLNWCFDVLINDCVLIMKLMNSILYICAAHFIKLIVKEIKKITKYKLKNITICLESVAFTLL